MPPKPAAILGLIIGVMLSVWGVWVLIRRARMTPEERQRFFPLWIVLLLTLMGLAEAGGSIRKIFQLFG
jgi:uncharacterized membrane protein